MNDWKARLWCRFFLLSVFATMYLNDLQRSDFYKALGINARDYDIDVIRETNATAGRVFPLVLNVDHPDFFRLMDEAAASYLKIVNAPASNEPKPLKTLKRLPHILSIGVKMLQLYLMKPIDTAHLEGTVR